MKAGFPSLFSPNPNHCIPYTTLEYQSIAAICRGPKTIVLAQGGPPTSHNWRYNPYKLGYFTPVTHLFSAIYKGDMSRRDVRGWGSRRRKPKAESRKPKAEVVQTKQEAGSRKPKDENRKPQAEGQKPKAENRKPNTESRTPKQCVKYAPKQSYCVAL